MIMQLFPIDLTKKLFTLWIKVGRNNREQVLHGSDRFLGYFRIIYKKTWNGLHSGSRAPVANGDASTPGGHIKQYITDFIFHEQQTWTTVKQKLKV